MNIDLAIEKSKENLIEIKKEPIFPTIDNLFIQNKSETGSEEVENIDSDKLILDQRFVKDWVTNFTEAATQAFAIFFGSGASEKGSLTVPQILKAIKIYAIDSAKLTLYVIFIAVSGGGATTAIAAAI